MVPDAPPILAMTTGWPMCFWNSTANGRKMLSVSPPAAHGTIILMGRSGYCAIAGAGKAASTPVSAAAPAIVTNVLAIRHLPVVWWAIQALCRKPTASSRRHQMAILRRNRGIRSRLLARSSGLRCTCSRRDLRGRLVDCCFLRGEMDCFACAPNDGLCGTGVMKALPPAGRPISFASKQDRPALPGQRCQA